MNILALEKRMWQAAKDGKKVDFLKLVCAEAVMMCGGYRCTGEEYAVLIGDFGIANFEISNFQTVCESENIIQVYYVVTTTANSLENVDLAGKFHVTSTWVKRSGEWKLVFNMDSRIM